VSSEFEQLGLRMKCGMIECERSEPPLQLWLRARRLCSLPNYTERQTTLGSKTNYRKV
jgi:hypothetical protein